MPHPPGNSTDDASRVSWDMEQAEADLLQDMTWACVVRHGREMISG